MSLISRSRFDKKNKKKVENELKQEDKLILNPNNNSNINESIAGIQSNVSQVYNKKTDIAAEIGHEENSNNDISVLVDNDYIERQKHKSDEYSNNIITKHRSNSKDNLKIVYIHDSYFTRLFKEDSQCIITYETLYSKKKVFCGRAYKCDCGCTSSICKKKVAVSQFLYDELEDVKNLLVTEITTTLDETNTISSIVISLPNKIELTNEFFSLIRSTLSGSFLYCNCDVYIRSAKYSCKITIVEITTIKNDLYGYCSYDYPIQIKIADTNNSSEEKSPLHGFDRCGGLDNIINLIEKIFIFPILNIDSFIDTNGNYISIRPCKGIILYGISGTGKTFLCEALIEHIEKLTTSEEIRKKNTKFTFPPLTYKLCAADFKSPYDLIELFNKCKNNFKSYKCISIVMIDEIDAICPRRDKEYNINIDYTNALLSCLDGPNAHPGVFLIGTTNRINEIDEAIRRPGRLDFEIEIPVPDLISKIKIFQKLLVQNHIKVHWLEDIEKIKSIVKLCSGFVAADFLKLIQKAVELHFTNNQTTFISIDTFKSATKSIYPSGIKEYVIEIPNISWEDIGGYETIKEEFQEAIEWPIKYYDLYAKYNLSPPYGILLYGPPGNSKTMMAKAIAGETSMNFIAIKSSEIFSMWVGESEKFIRNIFTKARIYAPTIIFFDEIDAIASKRTNSNDSSNVENRVLCQLLNEMNGISSNNNIIVIGATNRPTDLDPAILRPGRFDKIIYVGLPDRDARDKIFRINGIEADKHLIDVTNNYSGAEIVYICDQAKHNQLKSEILGVTNISTLNKYCMEIIKQFQPRTTQEQIAYYKEFQQQNRKISV